ncbi:DUF11 domain-containing protein [Massilia sp. RP-1-19]|uniref:DUF11 domain-containing protein n=1 Tax=Massilia polaris TaxID=2728846 RepID=A0A848HHF9_9BURK|nr:DUF6701 domain-containing protein [Massilia polaris]NML60845.1 DUF11 domain-containing protein [Massilia polaris]
MAQFNLVTRLVLMLALALACQVARADTAIRLLKSFAGNVNFAGIQQTIRNKGNNKPCEVFDPSIDRTTSLAGIPSTATILSAQLYWAGSNYNPDFTVVFDGVSVSAEAERRYYSTTIGNNYNYYSGAVDVTEQVKKKWGDKKENDKNGKGNGNGNGKKAEDYDKYSFRGLTVDTNAPYCSVEGVLGGFALLVVYSDDSEPFRMLNLYEGFQYMRYNGISLSLSGFRVPNPVGSATGRVAHITWEGDVTLDGSGENLSFNGYAMTDSLNPSGNQFNSQSNIDGDKKSYGIDFDAYTVGYPVIQGGQTTASTRYESGQDLVLLSAEVVALPNVPMSDLNISMLQNNEMTPGQSVGYTVTVSNKGPSTESGPTVVTTTLPSGLAFVSGTGTGWTCSSAGQVVTCSNPASLSSGSALGSLILTAKVSASGTISVSAAVTGKMYDPVPENNTVIVKGVVSDGSLKYVFTDSACNAGVPLDSEKQCSTTLAPIVAGEVRTIYITPVSNGVPVAPSPATESMEFGLSCLNPSSPAGVSASYALKTLPVCASDGVEPANWSAPVTVTFNGVSAAASFSYADVGQIRLFLRPVASRKASGSMAFVSVPDEVRISDIKGNDGTTAVPGALADDHAFVIRAGVPFTVTVGAYAKSKTLTPNFGRESDPALFLVPAVSVGASTVPGKAAMLHDDVDAHDGAVRVLPELIGKFGTPANGKATAQFKWDDVGIIQLTPGIAASTYLDVRLDKLIVTPATAGRFIPHHFMTSTSQRMACRIKMGCPSGIEAGAYSREAFEVMVTARSASGVRTMNYRGGFAREVVLSAWDQAGGTVQKLSLSPATAPAGKFIDGVATVEPSYTLLNPFDRDSPQGPWGAPDSIYLRAVESGGAVSSKLPVDSPEAGIRIVNGRLLVPSAHGSERLNLPVQVSAQYWSGSNWEPSSTDNHNLIDPSRATFTKLNGSLGGSVLSLLPSPLQLLSAGTARFSVNSLPGKAGSVDLLVDHLLWLPSTKARIKFGTYKSPLIYLRELH